MIAKLLHIGNQFLKAGTSHSSLRLKTVMVVLTCCVSILIIVIAESRKDVADWIGAATALTSIGVIIGIALWGKNKGLAQENINNTNG